MVILTDSLSVTSKNVAETQLAEFLCILPEIMCTLLYTYLHSLWKQMKPMGSHGSLSLLFVMKATI
jgi:hypothetical protein